MSATRTKTCSKCEEVKPVSSFHKKKAAPDGRRYQCKECVRAYRRKRRRRNGLSERHREKQKRKRDIKNGVLTCIDCGKVKSLECYAKDSSRKHGRKYRCKQCRNKARRERAAKQDNETARKKSREKYRKRVGGLSSMHKRRKKREREVAEGKQTCTKCNETRPLDSFHRHSGNKSGYKVYCRSCARVMMKQRRERNPHAKRIRDAARRALHRDAAGQHSRLDVIRQWHRQNGCCFWCGQRTSSQPSEREKYHVDHITPISRGGSNWPRNLAVACPTCNARKYNLWPIEFKQKSRFRVAVP
jgi:hypothetical protein